MNNTILKSKYFILGLVVGISLLSTATYAAVTQAGTLGELFFDKTNISGINAFDPSTHRYRLHGDAIADHTIDNSEIENNTLLSEDIKDNTIESEDIKDNTIESKDIKDNTVESKDIKDNTIESEDIKDNTIESRDINTNYSLWNKERDRDIFYYGGRVGIGRSPDAYLHVSNYRGGLKVGETSLYSGKLFNTTKDLYIQPYGHKNIVLNYNSGKVGIGNNNPHFKLDVNGTTKLNGNVGIAAYPRSDSYKLSMGGHIHMNNKDINYINQLHFKDNVRFYDDGNDNYINFKYGDNGGGGIKISDGNNGVQGYLYSSGDNNSFGLLDKDGQWGVRIDRDDYVELRDNNEVTFRAGQGGVSGNYGTVQTYGNGKGGREGYSINGRYNLMSADNNEVGIYNDVDNEWMTYGRRNGSYNLYYNGANKFQTKSDGVNVSGNLHASSDIYLYDDLRFNRSKARIIVNGQRKIVTAKDGATDVYGNVNLGKKSNSYGRWKEISYSEYKRLNDTCDGNKNDWWFRRGYRCKDGIFKNNCLDLERTSFFEDNYYKRNVTCGNINVKVKGGMDLDGHLSVGGYHSNGTEHDDGGNYDKVHDSTYKCPNNGVMKGFYTYSCHGGDVCFRLLCTN